MPRARVKPSMPVKGIKPKQRRARWDRLGRSAEIEEKIEALSKTRDELVERGNYDDVARLDRRISDLARKRGDGDVSRSTGKAYARDLARVRRRGRTRDQLAHMACFIEELTPEMLQAADVYRMARGVDAGWPGCSLSFAVPGAVSEGGVPLISGADQMPAGHASARSTFGPKARNRRYRLPTDGGMAALIDRMAVERDEAVRVVSAFSDAVDEMDVQPVIVRSAEAVILSNVSLNAAAKGVRMQRQEARRKIVSVIITGLSSVANSLSLRFGANMD